MLTRLFGNLGPGSGNIKPSVPNPVETDVYLVSYPKSGNTWMRYLLAHAIWPDLDRPDLRDMGRLIPSYGLDNDIAAMLEPNAPCNRLEHRVIKEHFPFNRVAKKYVKNVIYLCRDGRDAIVSYWFFINQVRGTSMALEEFIKESSRHSFGPWHDHVQSWLKAPVNRIVIRYEEMLNNPSYCLERVLDFINIRREKNIITQAVDRSSFSSMKSIETTRGFNLEMIKNVDFIREGSPGAWKEYFDNESMRLFIKYHGSGINSLGYNW